jgi:hypothetical protein
LLLHAHGLTPHPVACREPGPPRQRMGGRFKLSRADPARLATRRTGLEKDASTDFCNRPTTRAPCGSIDSRERFPRGLAALRYGAVQVEPRLTANLQLRLCHNPLRVDGDFGPRSHPSTAPPGPGGAAIDSPSGRRSRSRCFRPCTEHATWPLTPSVAIRRARRRPFGRPPLPRTARPASTVTSSKGTA